jgi:hypothetical protein
VEGIGAGEDGCMRRPSERNLGDTTFEDDAVFRQRVHIGREASCIAVATHAIGAQGVYGDDQDVRTRGFILPARAEGQSKPKRE